jgi:DNA-binding NtrC family response regulator
MLQPSYSPKLDNEIDTINNKTFRLLDSIGLIGSDKNDLSEFSLKKIRKASTELIDKRLISYVLGKTGWNRSRASKILDISYKTMLEKIQHQNIEQQI